MTPEVFFSSSSVLVVAGKGGVGKTTVTAALGVSASRSGLNTMLIDIDGKRGLPSLFGVDDFTDEETVLIKAAPRAGRGSLSGRTVSPDRSLMEYLDSNGFSRALRRVVKGSALEFFAQTAPGLKDLFVLATIGELAERDDIDLVIVDAPASGHAQSFLRSPLGLLDMVDDGPIREKALEVVDMLQNPERSQVMLVTLPEETPVNELTETAYALEDDVGVALAPVVVNGVRPVDERLSADVDAVVKRSGVEIPDETLETLRSVRSFELARAELQAEQLRRLAEMLPLSHLVLPQLTGNRFTKVMLTDLADRLLDQIQHFDGVARVGVAPGAG